MEFRISQYGHWYGIQDQPVRTLYGIQDQPVGELIWNSVQIQDKPSKRFFYITKDDERCLKALECLTSANSHLMYCDTNILFE